VLLSDVLWCAGAPFSVGPCSAEHAEQAYDDDDDDDDVLLWSAALVPIVGASCFPNIFQ